MIAAAIVTLDAHGQLSVTCDVAVHVVMISAGGKGQGAQFHALKTGVSYNVYGFTKNGKLQISALSAAVLLKM